MSSTVRTRGLKRGNVGNKGGRPSNEFRAKAREKVEEWLDRCAEWVLELRKEAKTHEQRLRVLDRGLRLTELFGRFSGFEKVDATREAPAPVVIDFGGMSLEERKALLAKMEAEDRRESRVKRSP